MTMRLLGRGILASLLLLASSPGFAADTSLERVERFLGSLKTLSASGNAVRRPSLRALAQ